MLRNGSLITADVTNRITSMIIGVGDGTSYAAFITAGVAGVRINMIRNGSVITAGITFSITGIAIIVAVRITAIIMPGGVIQIRIICVYCDDRHNATVNNRQIHG